MSYSGETYDANFKLKVVLQAIRSEDTDTSVANAHDVHPVTLSRWKNHFLDNAHRVFRTSQDGDQMDRLEELKEKLEIRESQLEALQSAASDAMDTSEKVTFVQNVKEKIGLNTACDLIELPKSTYYYRTRDRSDPDPE